MWDVRGEGKARPSSPTLSTQQCSSPPLSPPPPTHPGPSWPSAGSVRSTRLAGGASCRGGVGVEWQHGSWLRTTSSLRLASLRRAPHRQTKGREQRQALERATAGSTGEGAMCATRTTSTARAHQPKERVPLIRVQLTCQELSAGLHFALTPRARPCNSPMSPTSHPPPGRGLGESGGLGPFFWVRDGAGWCERA